VKLGPDGKLSGVEVDLTLIQQKLKKMGALAPILDLEGSLSLNAEAGFDQQDAKLVFDGVQAAVKGEVQLRFKTIPILKAVRFKLSATVGPGGAGIGGPNRNSDPEPEPMTATIPSPRKTGRFRVVSSVIRRPATRRLVTKLTRNCALGRAPDGRAVRHGS
jgi:hypothetical protein